MLLVEWLCYMGAFGSVRAMHNSCNSTKLSHGAVASDAAYHLSHSQVAAGKRTQAELEDTILQLLSTASGSLLDNIALINTLDASKTTWEEVNESLRVAEETSKAIEAASAQYRPCSVRAAILYFVLNDLSAIDPMYQFSLDAYNDLFLISIKNSPRFDALPERIKALNDYHTYAVYKYTARGLFERHKLLLSLQVRADLDWLCNAGVRVTGCGCCLGVAWYFADAVMCPDVMHQ